MSYATELGFQSLIAPAYQDTTGEYNGVLISQLEDTIMRTQQFAKFLSPATVNFSVGIDFKPQDNLSIYYSPVAYKGIFVSDDAIAALNVHGNEEGKNTFHQLGSLLRILLNQKLAKDRVLFSSNLALYSNYLKEPQNIDIDWQNQLDFAIIPNLAITLKLNMFYDHDIKVQISDNDAPNGVNGTGRRVSLTQQLLLKYAITF